MDETNLAPNIPQTVYQKPRGSKRKIAFFTCGIILLIIACVCTSLVVVMNLSGSTTSSDDLGVTLTEKTTSGYGDTNGSKTAKIAIVDVSGAINYSINTDALPSGASNRTVIAQLNRAKADKDVKAIIVRFNTPGGAVSAAEPICKAMKDLNNTKPVYAFIDTEGASLGYLLPNCARSIYSRPDSITGSIGVRADLQDLNGILTNLGARQMTVTNTAGVQKTQDGLFDKNSDEFKQFQSMLDESYDYFLNKVWEGRKVQNNGLTYEKLKTYANGRIFSGLQAKKVGLVDEIGYQDDVINSVIKKENLSNQKIELVEYQIDSNPFAGIFGASLDLYSIIKGNHVQTKKVQLMMLAE
jgi:protease-4